MFLAGIFSLLFRLCFGKQEEAPTYGRRLKVGVLHPDYTMHSAIWKNIGYNSEMQKPYHYFIQKVSGFSIGFAPKKSPSRRTEAAIFYESAFG
jgi:hypothetical protein